MHWMSEEYAFDRFSSSMRGRFKRDAGVVTVYATTERMTRPRGERPTGMTDPYYWEPAARIARFVGTPDSTRVRRFRGNAWARITQEESNHAYWVAAEGRVDTSTPSREPGDDIEQEIRTTTDHLQWAEKPEHEQWEREFGLPRPPVRGLVVVRLHVT
ncbi:hypothetical protein [Streptomyces aureus]|uniref:hypothetical protein n=1 Tax=Streptomyces aureus TaxID=193461 RepID=UPI0006E44731|nr:hypothetical protein [Streptomyces aureus]